MSNMLDKSFYTFIPRWMQEKLEMKILLYKNEPWFETAWNKYANICKSLPKRQIPDPDEFFEKEASGNKSQEMYAVPSEEPVKFSVEDSSNDTLMAVEETEEVKPSNENTERSEPSRKPYLEISKRNFQKRRG